MDNKEILILVLSVAGFIIASLLALAGWFFSRLIEGYESSRREQSEALNQNNRAITQLSISMEKLAVAIERTEQDTVTRYENAERRIQDNHDFTLSNLDRIDKELIKGRDRYHEHGGVLTALLLKAGLDDRAREVENKLREERRKNE